jgi:hypothetical protein
LRPFVKWALALTVILSGYVLLKRPLGVSGEWWIAYREILPQGGAVMLAVLCAAVFIGLAAAFDAAGPCDWRVRIASPLACTFAYFLLLVAGAACGPRGKAEFIAPVFKDDAAGFFQRESVEIDDARAYLREFPQRLARYAEEEDYRETVSVNNNPPGATMLFYLSRKAVRALPGVGRAVTRAVFGPYFLPRDESFMAAMLGAWVLTAVAALSFIPAYLIALRIASRSPALVAAAACLAGSMVLFVPGKDTLQVFALLWMLYLYLRKPGTLVISPQPTAPAPDEVNHTGVFNRASASLFFGLLFGLVAAGAFFFTLATAVFVAVLFVHNLWLLVARPHGPAATAAFFWAGAGAGLLVGFGILHVAVDYNSIASLRACYRNHSLFYEHFPRTYWKWLLVNPIEFAIFLGGGLVAAVGLSATGKSRPGELRQTERSARTLVLACLVVLLALNISGKNASEVARLWVFFMPLLALPAIAWVTDGGTSRRELGVLVLLQIFTLIVLRVHLDVWRVEALFSELGF